MIFAFDTQQALAGTVALVNTARDGQDRLTTVEQLETYFQDEQFSGRIDRDEAEVAAVRRARDQLARFWHSDEAGVVALVNEILADADAIPQLVKHDQWDWHIHATAADDPLDRRIAVEAALAVADVVRGKDLARLRVCAADDCDAVLVDFSKNRSKRYCDTGNCANRVHVASYRARKAHL